MRSAFSQPDPRKRIAIVGAGISGLALAEALLRLEASDRIELLVLESTSRPGGHIHTEQAGGFVFEHGPNGFLDNAPATLALVRRLGLEKRLLPSRDAARRRFVYARGQLRPVPASIFEFVRSDLLSWSGKARLLGEPFAARRPPIDESIAAFARRRIGREAASKLVAPMVLGIFAGDAARLSLRACFPKMYDLETEYGGLVRALLALSRRRRVEARAMRHGPRAGRAGSGSGIGMPTGRLTSFQGGMAELVEALTRRVGPRLRLGARVTAVRFGTAPARRYVLDIEGFAPIDADAVAFTGSATEAARALEPVSNGAGRLLAELSAAPIVSVSLGFDRAALGHPLDGFGFLVPRGEGPRILGALWDSSIYDGRAPVGYALLRVMIGGACDPGAVDLPDEELLRQVGVDLQRTMGIAARPAMARIVRHRIGIPQYTLGHLDRTAAIEAALAGHPGLFVGGSSYRGVSLNNCIAEAEPLARRILDSVGGEQ